MAKKKTPPKKKEKPAMAKAPFTMTAPMTAMAAQPELQAGQYANNFLVQLIFNWLDAQFPGAKAFLEQMADLLPWSKLWQAIQHALADYAQGQDFLTILKHVLEEWGTFEPATGEPGVIRFTAKPGV